VSASSRLLPATRIMRSSRPTKALDITDGETSSTPTCAAAARADSASAEYIGPSTTRTTLSARSRTQRAVKAGSMRESQGMMRLPRLSRNMRAPSRSNVPNAPVGPDSPDTIPTFAGDKECGQGNWERGITHRDTL